MKTTNMYHTLYGMLYRRSMLRFYAALIFLFALAACDADLVTEQGGAAPDEAAMGVIGSAIRGNLSFSGRAEVNLFVGEEGGEPETTLADELTYTLSQPAKTETRATITVGTELTPEFMAEVERINAQIKEYNKLMSNFPVAQKPLFAGSLFPAGNVEMETNALTVPTGKTVSQSVKINLLNRQLNPDSIYLLPIVVKPENGKQETLQYWVKVTTEKLNWENAQEVIMDTDFLTIYYVNTEEYQPLVAGIYGYNKRNYITNERKSCSVGNIINLKPAAVGYDASSGRATLSIGNDLRYVLEHTEKYIRPLQNRGRKVCVCIQGGSKGIGFCNMTDAQITDFTAQVKTVIERYNLDGINLWDEGAAYGKEGMPPANTTSYPKLIKAMREAMSDKLLTLVDKDEPTAHFHDAAACGGIEVGKLIDYAWHGYFSEKEQAQVVEPWAQDHPYADHTRKPIAGLSPDKYGSVNVPRYGSDSFEHKDPSAKKVIEWRTAGRKKNNIIVFGFDLTANEAGAYEGQPMPALGFLNYVADGGSKWAQDPRTGKWGVQRGDIRYSIVFTNEIGGYGYNLFRKDW